MMLANMRLKRRPPHLPAALQPWPAAGLVDRRLS
jgi:hypothetical protein